MINQIKDSQMDKYHYLLLFVIIFFILLQSSFLLVKDNFTWDEENNLLIAAGRRNDYINIIKNRKYPYGELVDIQIYKDLFKIKNKFCFGDIAKDISISDSNPPLYTWLLHLWTISTGGIVQVWSARLLNLILCLFIILLLFLIAFQCFNSYEDALFAAVLFSLSPLVHISNHARSYFLLILIILLANYFLINFIKKSKEMNLYEFFLFSIMICLGLLCHYSFIFICATWIIFFCTQYWRTKRVLIFQLIVSCLLGILLFCNIFPGFIGTLMTNEDTYLKTFTSNEEGALHMYLQNLPFLTKIAAIITQRLHFIFSEHQRSLFVFLLEFGPWFTYLCAGIIIISIFCIWLSIKRETIFRFIFYLVFYPQLIISSFIISRNSPLSWYVYGKYALFILPFFYLTIIYFLKRRFSNIKRTILVCLCVISFFSTSDNIIVEAKNKKDRLIPLNFYEQVQKSLPQFNSLNIVLVKPTLTEPSTIIFKTIHELLGNPKIIIADADYLLLNYSYYFGEESELFPFVYIVYRNDLKNPASCILINKLINDKDLKISPQYWFNNFSKIAEEVVFYVERIVE